MLESITPEEAVEAYLKERESELLESSLQNQGYRLGQFVEWCEEVGLEDMNNITGRKLHDYKMWRSEGIKPITLKSQLDTLRMFLRFCERIEAAPKHVHERVSSPTITGNGDQNDDILKPEAVDQIFAYLEKWEYASFRHVAFYLLWHTGMRSGSARAIDVDDYNSEEGYVEIKHRPDTETPLKNKEHGERHVNLNRELCDVIDDFLKFNHKKVADDYGRMPLFCTSRGRAALSTIRRGVYQLTRPCVYTDKCPHDRVIEDCEATKKDHESKCPSSVAPHAIRRGAITYHLNSGVPKEIVSDRMNVSDEVLEKHYDERTAGERRSQRQSYLDHI
ncbi:tyrosine-type recombinase/integrase [Haloarcula amylovorans]|uniref:tyrosine-type recombinase/integrase n=1 Tax=Haloarcula amylovorans TaxID=2562280 RepID=UPI001076A8A9|nr:site-specific integrase [Halomicroarcula amylolytica]